MAVQETEYFEEFETYNGAIATLKYDEDGTRRYADLLRRVVNAYESDFEDDLETFRENLETGEYDTAKDLVIEHMGEVEE